LKTLEKYFKPHTIAIIGASDKQASIGNTLAKNVSNYKRKVFFVNPRLSGKKILNKQVFASILEIKETIDLAVIAVPAVAVISVIEEIAKTKCKNILMVTSGFSEIGRIDITENIKKLITKHKINLVGPNCLGLLNLENNLDITFNDRNKYDLPKVGRTSIISQSGALGLALLDLSSKEQLEINKFISYGNALDVDESDLLEYFYTDKSTDLILCYIEGVQNGKKFFETLKKVTKKKKVIILKGGISEKGTTAVKSHTAAIAGSSKVFSTAVKQAGAKEVDNIRDLFNLAKFYSWYKTNKMENIQIITNGGGFGVITTDQLDLQKIKLAETTKETKEKIKKIVPIYATTTNPIDLTGDADNARFCKVIDICLKDKNVSAIAVLMLLQLPSISSSIVNEIASRKSKTHKSIFLVSVGGSKTDKQLADFEKQKVLCFKDPKDLSRILKQII
jgi:acyl-CoA synthetase (NDP forming)